MARDVKTTVKDTKAVVAEDVKEDEVKNVYVVKKGDRLSDIATKQGVSVRKLIALNKLEKFEVEEGTTLTIRSDKR